MWFIAILFPREFLRINEIIYVKCLEECLACSMHAKHGIYCCHYGNKKSQVSFLLLSIQSLLQKLIILQFWGFHHSSRICPSASLVLLHGPLHPSHTDLPRPLERANPLLASEHLRSLFSHLDCSSWSSSFPVLRSSFNVTSSEVSSDIPSGPSPPSPSSASIFSYFLPQHYCKLSLPDLFIWSIHDFKFQDGRSQ